MLQNYPSADKQANGVENVQTSFIDHVGGWAAAAGVRRKNAIFPAPPDASGSVRLLCRCRCQTVGEAPVRPLAAQSLPLHFTAVAAI